VKPPFMAIDAKGGEKRSEVREVVIFRGSSFMFTILCLMHLVLATI
jgi:hypothetical protein